MPGECTNASNRKCEYDPASTIKYHWVCKPNASPSSPSDPDLPPTILNPYNVTLVTDKTNEIKILPEDFFFLFGKPRSVIQVDAVTITTGEDSGIHFSKQGVNFSKKCYQFTGTFYTPNTDGFSVKGLPNYILLNGPPCITVIDALKIPEHLDIPGNNKKITIIVNIYPLEEKIFLFFNSPNIFISNITLTPITLPSCDKCSK